MLHRNETAPEGGKTIVLPLRKDITKEFSMKNSIKLFGVIAMVAIIGFSMAACDNGSTGGGGKVPEELRGKWLGNDGGPIYLFFNADGWDLDYIDFPTTITYKVKSVSGNTVNWNHAQYGDPPSGSFKYSISSDVLTISEKNGTLSPSNGTYNRQP